MTLLVMMIGLLGAAVLQPMLAAPAWLGGVKVPLLFAVVLYYALQRQRGLMFTVAVAAGFLQDALSPAPLGYSSVCFVLCAGYASRYRRLVVTDSAVTQIVFGLLATGAATLLLCLLLLKDGLVGVSIGVALLKIAGTALLGAVAAPLVCAGLGALDRTMGGVQPARDVEGPEGEFDAA